MAQEFRTNINLEKDPDMIWGMVASDGRIEMRFDCGDAGLISLTPDQAKELRDDLDKLLSY